MSLAAFLNEESTYSSAHARNEPRSFERLSRDAEIARGRPVSQASLPTEPPFTAKVRNLSYEAAEEDIGLFFEDVKEVRLILDRMTNRSRGIAYVEFATIDGLKQALEKNGQELLGRSIFVEVAEQRASISRETSGFGREPGLSGEDRTDTGTWRRAEPMARGGLNRVHESPVETAAEKDTDWRAHAAPVTGASKEGALAGRREQESGSGKRYHPPAHPGGAGAGAGRVMRHREYDSEWSGGAFTSRWREPRARSSDRLDKADKAEPEKTPAEGESDWRRPRGDLPSRETSRSGIRRGPPSRKVEPEKERALEDGWRRA
ncbi:Eukaryotic translation initiation factor 4B [Spiromyces aspiralis]|uniref:Eukaryotic translation initiation factor 4B n=1 Tax=Spiromyces aspiralis TaxID=68401 RepID=A0ACC1HIM4_9FUNG|nr:Eukaryotic translation initiation factor 4B [Spiromyces aspiralis]